jgi:AcrR family transcriptional regulator
MRSVAAALDTGPASLYVYVANRDELQRRIVDRVIGEIPLPAGDRPWRDELTDLMRDAVRTFVGHPGVARFLLGRIPYGPNALRLIDAMLAVLARGGIPGDVAGLGIDLLALYINAQAIEAEMWIAEDVDTGDGELENVTAAFTDIDAQRLPALAAMWPQLVAGDGDVRFEYGLQVLIDGIVAQSAIPAAAPPLFPAPDSA